MAQSMARSLRVFAPAKINLHLGIGPVREDGYHELATIYHAIALFDEVNGMPSATSACPTPI